MPLKRQIFWYGDISFLEVVMLNLSNLLNFKNLLHTYMNQVSELLGSFGDNELSPECLDGAQRFLKPDGISIPSSYWTFSYTYISLIPDVKNMLNIIWLSAYVSLQIHQFHPTNNSIKIAQRRRCLQIVVKLLTFL